MEDGINTVNDAHEEMRTAETMDNEKLSEHINRLKTPVMEETSKKYGETWHLVRDDAWVSKAVDGAIQQANMRFFDVCRKLSGTIMEVEGDDHYVISVNGGNNGSGLWRNYIDQLHVLFNELEKRFSEVWIIELHTDNMDDMYRVIFGANY